MNNTFGVSEEVIQACLSFRTKMVDFMTYKLTVEENREEICSVINNIYSAFGCKKRNISVSDFFITSDDGKWAEFLFPVYRNLRYNSKGKETTKKVFRTMSPVWEAVKNSEDLAILLEHRSENPMFDEVLFALVLSGAWNFGEYAKTCGDLSIIWNRMSSSHDEKYNGYSVVPISSRLDLCKYIIKSFIGSICAEVSVDEVVRYETCFLAIQKLFGDVDSYAIKLISQVDDDVSHSVGLPCLANSDLLEASYKVESRDMRSLLQTLSLRDVVRCEHGFWHLVTKYDSGIVNMPVTMRVPIVDNDLLSSLKVYEMRNGEWRRNYLDSAHSDM